MTDLMVEADGYITAHATQTAKTVKVCADAKCGHPDCIEERNELAR